MSRPENKCESFFIERVICCQRVVAIAFEFPGERKVRGPKYGNTNVERYFAPGDHMKGRYICSDCPRTMVGKTVVFPGSCNRQEATLGAGVF